MQSGAKDLFNWLNDLVKTGVAHLSSYEEEYWQSISKKMVDSKLSGVSHRILKIQSLIEKGNDWEDEVLKEISNLHILSKALTEFSKYSRIEQLTFLNLGGFSITKKHLAQASIKKDVWQILGVQNWVENKMKVRQTWIQGLESKFMGMILDYAWGNQEFMTLWEEGKLFRGEIKLYPSSFPLRVMVESYQHVAETRVAHYAAYPNIDVFFQAYAKAIALNPLLPKFPLCIKNVRVLSSDEKIFLIDEEDKHLECNCDDKIKWAFLAVGSGNPMKVFATWDGHRLSPKSVLLNKRFISLGNS